MRILYVEDLEDIRDLVMTGIESEFHCQITAAPNGLVAQVIWEKEGPFDLVISDYEMPLVNGGELYKYINQLEPSCPFILLSSHLPQNVPSLENFMDSSFHRNLQKPDQMIMLNQVIHELLDQDVSHPRENTIYTSIGLPALSRLNQIPVNLYIRLSESKHVCVIKANELYSHELIEHYKAKVKNLYCLTEDYPFLSRVIFEHIRSAVTSYSLSEEESLGFQIEAVAMAHHVLKNHGVDKQIIELADKTLGVVYQKAVRDGHVQDVLKKVLQNDKSYLYIHSLSIPYVAIALCSVMGWFGQSTLEPLSMAALIHDSTLDPQILDKYFGVEFDDITKRDMKINFELRRVYDHPMASAMLITSDLSLPPMVQEIIEQHHERPGGIGYPRGLQATEINPLTAVFILSEELIHYLHRYGSDEKTVQKALLEFERKYNCGNFREPFKAMKLLFSKKN